MNFITSNRSSPCPICSDISGKCRSKATDFTLPNHSTINEQLFLCMSMHQDSDRYKFTGDTSDGLWGKFITFNLSTILSNAWSTQYVNRNKPRRHQPPIIKRPPTSKSKSRYQHPLKIEPRSRAIKLVLSQLSLTPTHREALIKRGFTDNQIEQYGFKSVKYQQPLNTPVTNRLAGVANNGRHLTNKFSGLIVPIKNESGFYIGWQYRLDNAFKNRYLWAKSGRTSSHLSEYSELPLSFNFPDRQKSDCKYIALTEGVGFKPQLTANRFGLICLGASGGMFAVSPQLFKVYLDRASSILQTKRVLLFPDAGAVKNPNLLKQYKRTINLVQRLGYNIAIAWWEQINKSCPDSDELTEDYQIISVEEFFALGLKYCAFFPDEDNHNVVRQFLDLLQNTNHLELKQAICTFQSRYIRQFDLIKRICWRHLNYERKQLIHSIYA